MCIVDLTIYYSILFESQIYMLTLSQFLAFFQNLKLNMTRVDIPCKFMAGNDDAGWCLCWSCLMTLH